MGVLKGFERRLEGAVEGMFARIFKSGLQPIELAQAVQRYATDHRLVTSDGVVVCNDYRISINPADADRLSGYGASLPRELAHVVHETAEDHGWRVPGDVTIDTVSDDEVDVGRLRVVGRVRAPGESPQRAPDGPSGRSAAAARPAPLADRATAGADATSGRGRGPAQHEVGREATQALPPNGIGGARTTGSPPPVADLRLQVVDTGVSLDLVEGRYVIGRLDTCDLPVDSTTVSREHAAMLRRGDTWWVVDLGSTNGTQVNGVRASEQPVRPGDRVRVGTIDLVAQRPPRARSGEA